MWKKAEPEAPAFATPQPPPQPAHHPRTPAQPVKERAMIGPSIEIQEN